jgi:hypothetical protein
MLIKILETIRLEIFVQGLEREAERGGERGPTCMIFGCFSWMSKILHSIVGLHG